MTSEQMKARTKQYGLSVIQVVVILPRNSITDVIGKQLVRCATSVGANYRAACRAKSAADFIAKLKIVEEEADESLYWMELLEAAQLVPTQQLRQLMIEGNEIVSIIVASIKTKRQLV